MQQPVTLNHLVCPGIGGLARGTIGQVPLIPADKDSLIFIRPKGSSNSFDSLVKYGQKAMPQLLIVVALSLILAGSVSAQRPGGEIRKRTDAGGNEYFEVFADARRGEHGSPAPMRTVAGHSEWPKLVLIRAESTWTTNKTAKDWFDGNGKQASVCPACPAPSAPLGALIARWVKLDATKPPDIFGTSLPTEPLSLWFLVGIAASVEVPVQKAGPTPFTPRFLSLYSGLDSGPEMHYTPLIALQYQCNSNDFSNSDGWLHVYQEWRW